MTFVQLTRAVALPTARLQDYPAVRNLNYTIYITLSFHVNL